MCTTYVLGAMETRRKGQSPSTGGTDSCELSYRYWELDLGPLQEQPAPLTVEPPLQYPPGGSCSFDPLSQMVQVG